MRAHLLAALLGCLAVFALGAANVVSARVITGSPHHSTAAAPCSHCSECGKLPCPTPNADCLHAPSPVPLLAGAGPDLSSALFVASSWSSTDAILTGLSRPPDPFPPRA